MVQRLEDLYPDVRRAAGATGVQPALAGRELRPGGSLVAEQLISRRAEPADVEY
jgi:hypothetical protein